jgi:hypothetical protein
MTSLALRLDCFATDAASKQATAVFATTTSSRDVARVLVGIRGGYCRAVFEDLARSSPRELMEIVRENRAPETRMTFAAEILGRDVPTSSAANALLGILQNHPSPLVREGAVLGLAHHLDRIGVRHSLRAAAEGDPSPGVKRAVAEVLDED